MIFFLIFFLINPIHPFCELGFAQNISEYQITWVFDQPYECGKFVTGSYWVIGPVMIVDILPSAVENGAMVNPKFYNEYGTQQQQGFLDGYHHYNSTYNIMEHLPYRAIAGESIVKILAKPDPLTCGTSSTTLGCAWAYSVLTVLHEVPADRGAKFFRPPFHGDDKYDFFTIDKIKWERLPNIQFIKDDRDVNDFTDIYNRWRMPHFDITHSSTHYGGEFMRATAPESVLDDYAAGQASMIANDILSLFGNFSKEEKEKGVYGIIQKGIDVWSVVQMGIPFGSGAGQHSGRKPAVAFFAAMYDDIDILNEVRSYATDFNRYVKMNYFQEDSQIHMSTIFPDGTSIPLWGDSQPFHLLEDHERYDTDTRWSQYFGEWTARRGTSSGYDNKGTYSDPYGYCDGPPGGPAPTMPQGRTYQGVNGNYIGYAIALHLMPWLAYANNNQMIMDYVDRSYDGYGIPDFDGGWWCKWDICREPDSREDPSCAPYTAGDTNCLYFKDTWGPDENGDCIQHYGNALTQGRWQQDPELHGRDISFVYVSWFVKRIWSELRECSDPTQPSYPCKGMGPLAVPLGLTALEIALIITIVIGGFIITSLILGLVIFSIFVAITCTKGGRGSNGKIKKDEEMDQTVE